MNLRAVNAIYTFEMARTGRTIWQSIVSPVLSTSLYFVVFGAAIGSRINEIEGVSYGAFIVPGLIMLTLLTQSTMNASFGIYFPRFTGTIYEILSAPVYFLSLYPVRNIHQTVARQIKRKSRVMPTLTLWPTSAISKKLQRNPLIR